MSKKLLYFTVVILFFVMMSSGCQLNNTVAKVNEVEIQSDELNKQMVLTEISYTMNGYEIPTGEEYKKLQLEMLNNMVEDVILLDLAKGRDIISDEETARSQGESIIQSIIDSYGSEEDYENYLRDHHQSRVDFEEYIMTLSQTNQMIYALYDAISKDVVITNTQLQNYYEENQLYYSNSTVSIMNITLDNEDTAQKLYEKIHSESVKMEDVLKQPDQWEGVEEAEELEEIYYGDMEDVFSNFVFEMKTGDVSEPFMVNDEYHIVSLYDKDIQKPIPFETIKDTVNEHLLTKRRTEIYNEYLQEQKVNYQMKLYPDRL
ncbi:MAG: peptidyl-prolyl cis-trans isomerase [Eubacteriales bacterium]